MSGLVWYLVALGISGGSGGCSGGGKLLLKGSYLGTQTGAAGTGGGSRGRSRNRDWSSSCSRQF